MARPLLTNLFADYYQRISKLETSTQTTANDYCQRISKPKPSKQTTADDCYSKQTTADDCHRILKPKDPHVQQEVQELMSFIHH